MPISNITAQGIIDNSLTADFVCMTNLACLWTLGVFVIRPSEEVD